MQRNGSILTFSASFPRAKTSDAGVLRNEIAKKPMAAAMMAMADIYLLSRKTFLARLKSVIDPKMPVSLHGIQLKNSDFDLLVPR